MEQQSILIVDHDHILTEMLRTHLEEAGYSVGGVNNEALAIRSIKDKTPDLLIGSLLRMDPVGVELNSTVRHELNLLELPIIILSERASREDILLALERGADDCITRPFSPGELIARVRAMLRRRQSVCIVDQISSQNDPYTAPSKQPRQLAGQLIHTRRLLNVSEEKNLDSPNRNSGLARFGIRLLHHLGIRKGGRGRGASSSNFHRSTR
jgi:DNA-binding response OmpR family regulator